MRWVPARHLYNAIGVRNPSPCYIFRQLTWEFIQERNHIPALSVKANSLRLETWKVTRGYTPEISPSPAPHVENVFSSLVTWSITIKSTQEKNHIPGQFVKRLFHKKKACRHIPDYTSERDNIHALGVMNFFLDWTVRL